MIEKFIYQSLVNLLMAFLSSSFSSISKKENIKGFLLRLFATYGIIEMISIPIYLWVIK